jgi:hypothetical protein
MENWEVMKCLEFEINNFIKEKAPYSKTKIEWIEKDVFFLSSLYDSSKFWAKEIVKRFDVKIAKELKGRFISKWFKGIW